MKDKPLKEFLELRRRGFPPPAVQSAILGLGQRTKRTLTPRSHEIANRANHVYLVEVFPVKPQPVS
jgi:hypothetical protein